MKRRVLAAVMLGELAACGGDDGDGDQISDEERPYYGAMVVQFQTETNDELTLDEPQAECMAARWMEVIGVERFAAAGLTPDELQAQPEPEVAELELDEPLRRDVRRLRRV